MKKRICPRCGKKIPSWQPVHLPCLAYRLRYVIGVIGVVLVLIIVPQLGKPGSEYNVTRTPIVPTHNATQTRTSVPKATFTPTRTKSTLAPTITQTRSVVATRTSTVRPQPTVPFDWSKCHATYSTRLKVGDQVTIGNFSSPFGYNVLEAPYKDREKIGKISPGDQAIIVNGPSCSNKWVWWVITVEQKNVTGWFPEGDANSYWLLPVHGNNELGLARISNQVDKVNLRHSPGYISKDDNKDVVVEIPSGATVKLLEGPRSADGLNWWYVSWNGYQGWIAEKTGSGKAIMIFNP